MKSELQIDILGFNDEFKFQGEYAGSIRLYLIQSRVKSSTKVESSKLKEGIEKKELRDFRDDVTKFNTWFRDT